ncbi:type IV pilus assembly protein PilM [Clostridium formicaceticum]|uniref:Cell division protein FtsA n=1 Tax=Clostridium formicaceticum TaxID=1497 RepID=A0AAC9RLJ7_9CLOT|nr:type IV pilus assembly protein PilM [Clostridium formicaceticum]AOY77049.1 hypothetical protein BJL90_15035 [Clostridium formicaceticum]ARE87550.1 Cell division protein FtsA [Clostridium formicaceticum]
MKSFKLKSFKSFSKNKDVLVLDLGSHSVKVIIGKYEKSKVIVSNAFTVPIPLDCYRDGKIVNMLEVKEVLKKALEENHVKTKATICTIESSFVITREILLPVVQEEELKEMIQYEVGQYLPIELDKYVIQHKMMEEVTEENISKYRILVVALPVEIAWSHFELLEFLDLSPVALDLHANAICKIFNADAAINDTETIESKTIAVIDLGYSHINVIIIENGIYKFNRMIDLGAGDMDTVIANYLNLDLKEVEEQKLALKSVFAGMEEAAVSNEPISLEKSSALEMTLDVIKSTLDNWIDEINRVFKYYTSRSAGNRIDGIFIYGGNTGFKGLDQYMTHTFGIPTAKVNGIKNVEMLHQPTVDDLPIYLNAIAALIRK